jgi:hypothetical protein
MVASASGMCNPFLRDEPEQRTLRLGELSNALGYQYAL